MAEDETKKSAEDETKKPWWLTLPVLITAIGGFIAAIAGLVTALTLAGFFGSSPEPPPNEKPSSDHSPPDGGVRPAATDEQGFLDSDARCDPEHPAAAMGSTTQTKMVLCQTGPGTFYYRGVRHSDGVLTALANAVRSASGFDVTNPADGTRYEIRRHRLTLRMTDGHVAAEETMVEYWLIPS
jgi:serine/threonine-protein kinase